MSEKSEALGWKLVRLNAVSSLLMRDAERCRVAFGALSASHPEPTPEQREEGQFWLRMLTRTFFSLIEGSTYTMRQIVLELHEEGFVSLDTGERAVLGEKQYRWDGNGVKESDRYLKARQGIEIAFFYFARAYGVEFKLSKGNHLHDSFQRALDLRNAITHPKDPDDLLLSSEMIKLLGEGIHWCAEEHTRLVDACRNKLQVSNLEPLKG